MTGQQGDGSRDQKLEALFASASTPPGDLDEEQFARFREVALEHFDQHITGSNTAGAPDPTQVVLAPTVITSTSSPRPHHQKIGQRILAAAAAVAIVLIGLQFAARNDSSELATSVAADPGNSEPDATEVAAPPTSSEPPPCPKLEISGLRVEVESATVAVVTWQTSAPATELVSVSTPGEANSFASPSGNFYEDFVQRLGDVEWSGLPPLTPDTEYEVMIRLTSQCDLSDSITETLSFRTAP